MDVDGATLGGLALLALLDSTSIGTLVLPVWMLLRPGRPPVRRVLLHLGIVAGCYLALGAVLLAVGTSAWESVQGRAGGEVVDQVQLVLGVGLFAGSFALDPKRRRRRGLPDRTQVWRARADRLGSGGTALLAGTAVVLEAATMLPYLAALGILGAARWPVAGSAAALTGYCLVMVTPALVLLVARVVAGARVEPALTRVDAWATRQGDAAMSWIVGIVGFLLARDAVQRLGG
ncbi:MAG: GAP family protein, partial [Pseudonocardia sediminis]